MIKVKLNRNAPVGLKLFFLFFIFYAIIAWFTNLVKLVGSDFEPSYKREILHGIGLFPPISLVTCWFNIKNN